MPARNTPRVRSSGPVVPARREQRIERSPVVRRAGEVRGRTRPAVRDDVWASVPDLAVPVGPLTVDDPPTLGDITYDRALPTMPSTWPLPSLPLEVLPAETSAVPEVVTPEPELQPATAPTPSAPPGPRRSLFRRRTRVRRVSRVVRRVDAWSVLKLSAIFYALAYGIVLVAGVLLWNLAQTTGTVANVEGFIRELFGLRTFTIDGERLYRASWPIGVFLAVAGTGLNVTAAVMFNLITDLVGGVRVTVLEEEIRVVETGGQRRLLRRASRQAG